jgi:hypothetical protein
MNAMLERLSHGPPAEVRSLFKGAFGIGMLLLIFVGAIFFLLNRDYTPLTQIIVAILGAALGAFCGWRINKTASEH